MRARLGATPGGREGPASENLSQIEPNQPISAASSLAIFASRAIFPALLTTQTLDASKDRSIPA